MLRLGHERDQLGVIIDQVGSPTYAIDLAGAILDIIGSGSQEYGIYHYSNEVSQAGSILQKPFFDISGTEVILNPVKTSEYITKAVRPAYSVMDKSKLKNTFGIKIPYWRDSLTVCLAGLRLNICTAKSPTFRRGLSGVYFRSSFLTTTSSNFFTIRPSSVALFFHAALP